MKKITVSQVNSFMKSLTKRVDQGESRTSELQGDVGHSNKDKDKLPRKYMQCF